MESDAIEGYVENVVALLWPALLARVWAWERLGLVAPPPEELAHQISDQWLAIRVAGSD